MRKDMIIASNFFITPFCPAPHAFSIGVIAHALSRINRFGGHSSKPISVAMHSCIVSTLCKEQNALWGLLYNAEIAFTGDIVRPIKNAFPDFKEFQENVQMRIANIFDLPWRVPEEVKYTDHVVTAAEMMLLLPTKQRENNRIPLQQRIYHDSETFAEMYNVKIQDVISTIHLTKDIILAPENCTETPGKFLDMYHKIKTSTTQEKTSTK